MTSAAGVVTTSMEVKVQIKKSDLLNQIKNLNNETVQSQKQSLRQDFQNSINQTAKAGQGVSLNNLRNQVLSLQSEMKTLQTDISMQQSQISFLKENSAMSNWQGQLVDFMQKYFAKTPSFQGAVSSNDYTAILLKNQNELKSSLIKKEVQLENILSSGLVSLSTKEDSLIERDLNQSVEIFGKLKAAQVKNLLDS